MTTHHAWTHPRARKTHVCDDCSRTIDPGERYSRCVDLADGEIRVWLRCAHCDVVVDYLAHLWGEWEEIAVHEFGRQGDEPAHELRVAAWLRRKWRRLDGSLVPVPVVENRGGPDLTIRVGAGR